jgi:ATP-dependent Clp protease adaptor protein ClpS
MSQKTSRTEEFNTGLKERVQRPSKYKVLLHNDDYTPFPFVILILQQLFFKTQEQAARIAHDAHHAGKSIVGVYPKEIAEMKCLQATTASRESGFPLSVTSEPE